MPPAVVAVRPWNDSTARVEELAERRRVDLGLLVDDDRRRTARPGQFADLDAVAVARVALQARRVAERLEAEFRCELILLERPARTRKTSFRYASCPVIACRNQPSDFFAAAISTTLRWFQFVSRERRRAS